MRVWVSGKGEDGAVTVGITYCHACYGLGAWVIVEGFPMVWVSVFKKGGRSNLFDFSVPARCLPGYSTGWLGWVD